MSALLHTKIAAARRKHASVALMTGLCAAVTALVLFLAAQMLLDWFISASGMPMGVRKTLLALNLSTVLAVLIYEIALPILRAPDDDAIALLVESQRPAFASRLIAAIQLARPGAVPADASLAMVQATVTQAESIAGPIDFAGVIQTRRMVKFVVASVLAVILGLVSLAWSGSRGVDLLRRAFLADIPVPRETRVTPLTRSMLAARGDKVEIVALAQGVIPDEGLLAVRTPQGNQSFKMRRLNANGDDKDLLRAAVTGSRLPLQEEQRVLRELEAGSSAAFAATIENVQESFDFRARLNDGESAKFTVTVVPRPAVAKIECQQVYPAYTGRATEARSLGDLSILQGSKLQLSILANKPLLRSASGARPPHFVHLFGSDKDVALQLDADDRRLVGTLDVPPGTTGFAVNLTDQHGLASRDPAVYRIDLVPDKPPTVKIVIPGRKESLLVREARQRLVFEATDDYAIGRAILKYKVDGGAEQAIALDLRGQRPRSLRGEHLWKLNEVPVPSGQPTLEGSVVEYWMEVLDTNDVSGPGIGASEHQMIRVVSEAEKRAEMAQRIAELGGTLRSATEDQEGLTGRVQTIVLERENPPPQPQNK